MMCWSRIPLLLMFWLCTTSVVADTGRHVIDLDDPERIYSIGRQVSLLEDPSGTMSLDEVMAAKDWSPSEEEEPNRGFTRSAIWVSFALKSVTEQDWILQINDEILNQIDVWFVGVDLLKHVKGGGFTQIRDREIKSRSHAFYIPNEKNLRVYIKLRSRLAVIFPAKIMSQKIFLEQTTLETWRYALYFGFLSAMLVFNLVVGVRMREMANLVYCIMCLSLFACVVSFSGFGRLYLWSNGTEMDNYIFCFSISSGALFAHVFTDVFLFDGKHGDVPLLRGRCLSSVALFAFSCAMLICGNIETCVKIGSFACIFSPMNSIFNVLYALKMRNRNAPILLLAWTMFMIGCAVFAGRGFGVFPSNAFTVNAFQFGSLFESLLLVVAIIEKSRIIKEELAVVNETAKARLEAEVKNRTAELIETQQKLIASEKMAALAPMARLNSPTSGQVKIPRAGRVDYWLSSLTPQALSRPLSADSFCLRTPGVGTGASVGQGSC